MAFAKLDREELDFLSNQTVLHEILTSCIWERTTLCHFLRALETSIDFWPKKLFELTRCASSHWNLWKLWKLWTFSTLVMKWNLIENFHNFHNLQKFLMRRGAPTMSLLTNTITNIWITFGDRDGYCTNIYPMLPPVLHLRDWNQGNLSICYPI